MAEVNDDDLGVLQRGMKLLQTLNSHPEARRHLEASLKAVDPKIKTTDEQARELLDPQLAELKGEIETLKAGRAKEDADRAANADADARARMDLAFEHLRRDDGLTDEGEQAVKQLMVDRNIADPAAAFALFQKQNPVVEVESASYEPSHWNYEKNAVATDVDGLWKDPDRWADQEAGRILTEMRKAPAQG